MLHVHPDILGSAPPKIVETNSQSVQEVNEYFQSLKNFQDPRGVKFKKVTFYIKKGDTFDKLKFDMLELKDGSSPDIKQRHYDTVIESMMRALNATLDMEIDAAEEDEIDAVEKGGYQFKTNLRWEDNAK